MITLRELFAFRRDPQLAILPFPIAQKYPTMEGKTVTLYYLTIASQSRRTIDDVGVYLERIDPVVPDMDWLPIPLKFKHDNELLGTREGTQYALPGYRHATEMNIHPGQIRHVDLVTAAIDSEFILVNHTVRGVATAIPPRKYLMSVVAFGRDVPPARATFEVYKNRFEGLQCRAV
jgi:hypothetical protein